MFVSDAVAPLHCGIPFASMNPMSQVTVRKGHLVEAECGVQQCRQSCAPSFRKCSPMDYFRAGGGQDNRNRDREFAERGPIPGRSLIALIRGTAEEACTVLERGSEDSLLRTYDIQGFRVSGFYAVSRVVEHFAYHTGQIIFVTKWRLGKDLHFTRLPGDKQNKAVHRVR
jgi:hypothetical protein